MQPSVTVIIPVKNGAATIHACLQSLRSQTIGDQLQIIVADSASTDGTLDGLEQYNVKVVHIEPGTFNHGLTRNACLQYATSEFVYFTVQDAALSTENELAKMLAHFSNPAVAGVTGNQGAPHDLDKNPVAWYSPVNQPVVHQFQFDNPAAFDALTPAEKYICCGWDNVNAMYRKSVLQQHPFSETLFAEDIIWAKKVLRLGHTLIIDTSVVTWHYHYRTYAYQFKVMLTCAYYYYREFEYVLPAPPVIQRLKIMVKRLLQNKAIPWSKKIHWFNHNLSILLADWKVARLVQRSLRKGGESALLEQYQLHCKVVVQGRLKGQLV